MKSVWYRLSKLEPNIAGYEGKIMRADATNAVRELLFLKCDYHPEAARVAQLVYQVMEKLSARYNSMTDLLKAGGGNEIYSAVKEAAREVVR